jgi:ABC-type nitrate/sulfonate/bicarbonate transport system substrate-binding protein
MKIAIRSLVGSILGTAALLLAAPALAQQKYVFGVPGIPAVFGGTVAFVAEKEGFFKKHGVDVTVRQFETGAAASRAVGSGEITVSLSPSPLIINQISNANAPLISLWGMEHPDWLIATTEANGTCATMKGPGRGR